MARSLRRRNSRQSAIDRAYQTASQALEIARDLNSQRRSSGGSSPQLPEFGAAGRGEVLGAYTEDMFRGDTGAVARLNGESDAEYRERVRSQPFYLANTNPGELRIRTLSRADSRALAGEYNIGGLGYDKTFEGLTASEARRRAIEIRNKLQGQTSELTSSAFNQDQTSGLKKASENLNAKFTDILNDSWLSKGTKEAKKKELLESTANSIANLFTSAEDFNNSLNTNPAVKGSIDTFLKLGGDINSITGRLQTNPQQQIVDTRRQAVQDIVGQGINDPNQILDYLNFDEKGNKVGDFTPEEVSQYMKGNNQDLYTYLSLSPNATKEQKKAWQDLIPERDLAQAEIAQLAGIPEKYKSVYFGTPEQIGILEEKRVQAEERKKLIEKKAEDEKDNLSAQADLQIAKNDAELQIAESEIQSNRLKTKNYMVGMLAKLGALKTTGAAPQSVANIEAKYDKQATQLRTQVRFANEGIKINLRNALNEVETNKQDEILSIQEDLTLDKEQVYKKIIELEASSAKQTFDILGRYAKEFRTQTEKYVKEAKAAAAKYVKDLASTLSDTDLDTLVEGSYIVKGKQKGVLLPDGTISPIALTPTEQKEIEASGIVGKDAIQFFLSTEPSFRDFYIRNNIGTGNRQSIGSVRQAYEQWQKDQEAKKKNKKSDEEEIVNPFAPVTG